MPAALIAAVLFVVVVASAMFATRMDKATNFSQRAGFAAYFAANPPSDQLPDAAARSLLDRFRPRFHAPAGHAGPVDFYTDYVAHGRLIDGNGNLVGDAVTRELLNRHKDDPRAEFVHEPPGEAHQTTPVIYGRLQSESVSIGGLKLDVKVLTYHAVFAHSGLPAGLLGWQAAALDLVGDLDDWHQLDHYTAATIVLDGENEPLALILQQHNYHRTYLFGEAVQLPEDGRVAIDIALRSNELYPHQPGRTNRRAVSFLNRAGWRYMIGAGPRLFLTADDITEPQMELDYELKFLPPDDAFYTNKGFLGEKRWLMGRSGPPGANYKTLPELLKFERQLLVGYWRDGHPHDIDRLQQALSEPRYYLDFANKQGAVFRANVLCARRWKADCAFD